MLLLAPRVPLAPAARGNLKKTLNILARKAGTDRAIPTSVATALSKEIKEFTEDEAPLMLLMSSPGIKKRHWDQIVKTTGITLPYEQDYVLRDLLDAGLQNFCAEIEEVCASLIFAVVGNLSMPPPPPCHIQKTMLWLCAVDGVVALGRRNS